MSTARRGFATLAIGNLAGKVIALVREILFASAFGSGPTAAGYRVAQSLSFVPANLFASDILSAAFAPTYARALKDDRRQAATMLRSYLLVMGALLALIAAGFALSASTLVGWVLPGADDATVAHASMFLSILSWTIPLYGVTQVFALARAANGRFGAEAIRPLLQSVGLIAGTALTLLTGWVPWLALGFVGAWAIYACASGWTSIRLGLLSGARGVSVMFGLRSVAVDARRIAPLALVPLLIQLSILLERTFSSLGVPALLGSVDYARTVSDSFMSLIAVPLGVLGLTRLSTMSAAHFQRNVLRIVDVVVILVVPISIVLVVLAEPIVRLLFARGSFGPAEVRATTAVLIGHGSLLAAQVLGYALSRALVAAHRVKIVVAGTVAGLVLQAATQSLVLTPLGSLAIGLGPSIYGATQVVMYAIALGVMRRVASLTLMALPIAGATAYVALAAPSGATRLVLAAGLVAAWCAVLAGVSELRNVVRAELFRPFLTRVASNP